MQKIFDRRISSGNDSLILMDTSPEPLRMEIDRNLRRHNHLFVYLRGNPCCVRVRLYVSVRA